jgi:RND family efflux transporter MFP subunit
MLELEQVSRLRLVVPVPEADAAGVRRSVRVSFRVPAFPGRTFSGTVARVDRSLDPKTRTMPVELDVTNSRGELAPGMFAEVSWPARRAGESLLVPPTAVVTTTERTFVIRVNGGRAEWVNVRRGSAAGEMVEVFGPLAPGDLVVRRANDEIREGTHVQVKKAT